MPEPDFEQIARRLAGVWADRGAVESMTESLAEQLRQVWNARGAADLAVFDDRSDVGELIAQSIRGLDLDA